MNTKKAALLLTVLATLATGAPAAERSYESLLDALAQVETGGDRRAVGRAGERGAWQMRRTAWIESGGSGRSFSSRAHHPAESRLRARIYLRILSARLRAGGLPEGVSSDLACAWRLGAHGYLRARAAGRVPAGVKESAARATNLEKIYATKTDR